jgi:transcriptional regulator with XRE-family HTH domain
MPCMKDLMVQFVSLVTSPANDKPVMIKHVVKSANGDRGLIEMIANVVKKDALKRKVYAVVYETGKVDLQGDWIEDPELEKTAESFLHWGYQKNVDMQHEFNPGFGTIVQSFILNGPDDRFPDTAKGAWCVVIELTEKGLARIDEIKGVSLAGMCRYDESKKPPTPLKNMDKGNEKEVNKSFGVIKGGGAALRAARRAAGLGEQPVADIMGVTVDELDQIEADQAEYEWTEDVVNALAKKVKMTPVALLLALMNGAKPSELADEANTDEVDPSQDENLDPNKSMTAEEKAKAEADAKAKAEADAKAKAEADAKKTVTDPDKGNETTKSKTTMDIRAEKKVIKSGHTSVADEGGEKPTNESVLIKSLSMEDKLKTAMSGIIKWKESAKAHLAKGIIEPEFIEPGGSVTPAQANSILSLIVEENQWLKQIQTKRMRKSKENVLVWDVEPRKLRRFKAGFFRGTDDHTTSYLNKSFLMDTNKVNLEWLIDLETLMTHADDLGNLELEIVKGFVSAAGNDLWDLLLNGTSDSTDLEELDWLQLGIGIRKLAQANPTAAQSILTGGATGLDDPMEIMDACIDAQLGVNERFDRGDHVIFMGKADKRTYSKTLGQRGDGIKVLIDGAENKYDGRMIAETPYMPAKNMIYTPFKNIVMGVMGGEGFQIQRFAVPDGILFRATMHVDFGIVNKAAMVDAHTVVL